MLLENRPKTIFCDIDGVLLEHCGDISIQSKIEPNVLYGVIDCLKKWDIKGYKIILTTGRKESMRKDTEEQLRKANIFYDYLLMGITGGVRVVINDRKLNSKEDTAIAICIDRNQGLKGIDI
jgi:hypothetical protein